MHTSRFVDANENNSGSSRRDRPSGFRRSTLPSTTPSTSNAIFYPDVYSRRFGLRRSLSGIKVGLPLNPDHDRILAIAAVNVSMPFNLQYREMKIVQLAAIFGDWCFVNRLNVSTILTALMFRLQTLPVCPNGLPG